MRQTHMLVDGDIGALGVGIANTAMMKVRMNGICNL